MELERAQAKNEAEHLRAENRHHEYLYYVLDAPLISVCAAVCRKAAL